MNDRGSVRNPLRRDQPKANRDNCRTDRPILSFCQCGVMRSWHKYVFLMHCDAIRKRPSMSVSLSSASLLSSHAFGMLAVFFVLVFDFGQISVVGRPVGELLEAGSMILWSFLLIPLSLSLHHLCEFRTKQAHHRSRILSLVGPVSVKSTTSFHGAAMQRPGGHFDLDLL